MTVLQRWVRRCVVPILLVLISVASLAAFLVSVVPLALLSTVWSPARKTLRLSTFALVVLGLRWSRWLWHLACG